ncbi:hypothetical protein STENM223S_00868 [Streptomyces tendae]
MAFWKTSGGFPPEAWVLNFFQKSVYGWKSVFTLIFGYFFSKSAMVLLMRSARSSAPHQE